MITNKIAIVTDTNSGIKKEEAEKLGIFLLPMPFIIDGNTYFEDIDLSQEQFYEYLDKDADISTSQPSLGDVMDLWDKILKTHDKIIHIPMSASLSGSMESAKMLSQDYDGNVLVVNNQRIAISQRQAVYDAVHWRSEGCSAEQIKENLEKTAFNSSIYLTVEHLKYLKKGGRITPAVAAIGTVLNIKPILQIQTGKIEPFKKSRGQKAAWKEMIKQITSDLKTRFSDLDIQLYAAYSGSEITGQEWVDYVQEAFPDYDIYGTNLPLSIATHTGPGVCGIACVAKYE